MNFANPHFFSAILDGINHRFVLIQECESLQSAKVIGVPRFSVGAVNATKDPRFVNSQALVEVGVNDTALEIPPGFLMAHQYIYIVHDNTDEHGWQYRSCWSDGVEDEKKEPWTRSPLASSQVRRRIWMTTVVDRLHLTLCKRLLSDNIRVDNGGYRMQGELLRYEKGTLTKSWVKRRVALTSNRLEFFSGSSKKGEVPLNDCEVKMLFECQCPGKNYAFSIRNPTGNVGIVLDAESSQARRSWVLAIQYQLAINSTEFNFPPMEYAPPTGEYPDNRVLLCGDLMLQGRDSEGNVLWSPRHFQLLPREIVYFENAVLMGRIFVENAKIRGDNKSLNFQIESASGIVLYLSADTPEAKNLWLLGVNKQIQFIENQKLKLENVPKEELNDAHIPPKEKLALYYDDRWTAPEVPGEDDSYLQMVFSALTMNNPQSVEFTELVPPANTTVRNEFKADKAKESHEATEETFETTGADGSYSAGERKSANAMKQTAEVSGFQEAANVTTADGRTTITHSSGMSKSTTKQTSSTTSSTTRTVTGTGPSGLAVGTGTGAGLGFGTTPPALSPVGSVSSRLTAPSAASPTPKLMAPPSLLGSTSTDSGTGAEPIIVNPRRSLINPKFILTVLKGVTHRFLLAMESETRLPEKKARSPRGSGNSASLREDTPVTKFPPRFTVGGPRASKDPRSTPIDELIEITSAKPEIQLPPGWVMMHQYIHIVQPNTDENGWQYRSDWAEGVLSSKDEQWCERYKPGVHNVRRRLWMTTVVKKNEVMVAKKLVHDSLNAQPKREVIMQGNLYRYNQELGQSSTSWQRRKALLYHNKIEFFIGNERKGEAELEGCTVRMLFGPQCPGRNYAFSLRNPSGSVSVLLEAENEQSRLQWVKALQYQISILTPDCNFPPFPYSPPTGEHPHNRILLCGDLLKDGVPMHFQLKYTQLLCYTKSDQLHCRLNLDQASMTSSKDETENEFAVRFRSGYVLSVSAESPVAKLAWVRAIRRQVTRLENDRLAASNTPPDEQLDDELTPMGRFLRSHDPEWTAPPLDLETELEFRAMEEETLEQLSRTEVWDGELKAVSNRPQSARSVASQRSGASNKSNGSSGRSSSRSRSRGRRGDSSEANSSSGNSKSSSRGGSESGHGAHSSHSRHGSGHSQSGHRGHGQPSASSNGFSQPPTPTSPVDVASAVVSPRPGPAGGLKPPTLAPPAQPQPQGVTTTTSQVTTTSSSSSSSNFTQSSSVTTTTGTAAAGFPAGFGGLSGAAATQRFAAGAGGAAPLTLSATFGKKLQPMTIDSDSD